MAFRRGLDSQDLQSTTLLAAALALASLVVSCGKSNADLQSAPPTSVKIAVAQSVAVSDTTEYVATLKSRDSAVIMPQVEGQVTKIFVRSGDRVSPETALMLIDPARQTAAVKSQEETQAAKRADVQWAKQQYDRISGLYAAGVVSKQDLDQAKTALDASEAQLKSLEAQVRQEKVQLQYYRVVAGARGIVGDIPVRVGDRVTTATVLTTVDKPGSLEAYVYVPVERASQLKMNIPLQVIDGTGKILADTRVNFISPQVDNTTQSILVKANIPNSNDSLRTLQFIHARMVWGTHQGPVVPVLAVSRVGGQYFVFVAEDEKGKLVAHQKPLRVGDMVGNDYIVLEGIKPGDKVIVSGTQFLVDGAPIAPQG